MYMRGCRAGQYSTLTCAHTHLNLWVLPRLVPKSMKAGFFLPIMDIFCRYPFGLGPIAIPNHESFFMIKKSFKIS